MSIYCREVRCIGEPCANLKRGICSALTETRSPCKFYKPLSQWQKELREMDERGKYV